MSRTVRPAPTRSRPPRPRIGDCVSIWQTGRHPTRRPSATQGCFLSRTAGSARTPSCEASQPARQADRHPTRRYRCPIQVRFSVPNCPAVLTRCRPSPARVWDLECRYGHTDPQSQRAAPLGPLEAALVVRTGSAGSKAHPRVGRLISRSGRHFGHIDRHQCSAQPSCQRSRHLSRDSDRPSTEPNPTPKRLPPCPAIRISDLVKSCTA
jgi:hypothetical protein